MKLKPTTSDLLVALPASLLILIGTALFTSVISASTRLDLSSTWRGLVILAGTAFITGLIIGLVRQERGPATALAAGELAAVIFLVLRLVARDGDSFNTLIFGLPGMVVAILACFPGGVLGARLQKAYAKNPKIIYDKLFPAFMFFVIVGTVFQIIFSYYINPHGWDAKVYCNAVIANENGLSPYIIQNIGMTLSWNYQPIFLDLFQFLCGPLKYVDLYFIIFLES